MGNTQDIYPQYESKIGLIDITAVSPCEWVKHYVILYMFLKLARGVLDFDRSFHTDDQSLFWHIMCGCKSVWA